MTSSSHQLFIRHIDTRCGTDKDIQVILACQGHERTTTIPSIFTITEETDYQWYLEDYATKQPFNASRAAKVVQSLGHYVETLSEWMLSSGILPQSGTLNISVEGHQSINHFHWELLEDTSKWIEPIRFQDVLVARTLPIPPSSSISWAECSTVNILLVTCRPGGRQDIDPQLISRSIVSTINQVARIPHHGQVRLHMLRPPTWLAFKQHLLYDNEPGHYALVHFDMHGEIQEDADGKISR
ncbi:MAG: hypothetical protein Q9219_004965 [cf. Caloplaca sp. 3 TL-2023]